MLQGLSLVFIVLLGTVSWQPPAASAETDCERANADYELALQQKDPGRAVTLLDGVVERCPSFINAWLVKGNAHRMLGQWREALAA